MTSIVTTLFEGDYVFGVGALVNSLHSHGFRGTVYAGYRGALTGWAEVATEHESYREITLSEGVTIRFIPLPPGWHLTNLKAQFMLDVWSTWHKDAEASFYFDPDIVIKCRWDFFENWVRYGVALCQESVMSVMPSDHPLRRYWSDWAGLKGWPTVRDINNMINGGFVGLRREQVEALHLWRRIIEEIGKETPMDTFGPGDRSHPFYCTDQDALNILTMVYGGALSRIGPEGMDFVGGGFTMSHAAGGVKPWRKKFVRSALNGIPPTLADKEWRNNLQTPIQVLSPNQVRRVRIGIRLASAIGRFIRRS